MASIGPQLPPHLTRQRDDNEDEEQRPGPSVGPAIPPHLMNRQQHHDEDEDDDEYAGAGPALPQDLATKRPSQMGLNEGADPSSGIGPSLPARLQNRPRGPEPPADESDEDDYMPALPPDLHKPGAQSASTSSLPPYALPKRVIGPSFPTRPPQDSDDEEIGPLPPSADDLAYEKSGVEEFLERERRREQQAKEAAEPKKLQRDAWMLAPPSSSELLGSLDPTKLRSKRTFGGGSARSGGEKEGMELWTETPQERLERLKAEVSGKRKRAGDKADMSAEEMAERERKRRRDEEIEMRVQEHNKYSARTSSLLDMHASQYKGDKKDKKDDVIWDHERDMSLGGRLMDDGKRKDIIKDARGLGGRFERGKTGGYL
ncbi:hypothetical protein CALCODRAFT_503650 [Calocera cornea HHB12733]|uniref:DUF3752 domain-containing protein n=1 Tax=Calocera cornea HHB12733 TaxID=1353952 RepID=A0A165CT23_9BASI|nr:hypothetical protein CALCODRAFT_503650 [Calocera cornea HHB12733]